MALQLYLKAIVKNSTEGRIFRRDLNHFQKDNQSDARGSSSYSQRYLQRPGEEGVGGEGGGADEREEWGGGGTYNLSVFQGQI